MLTVYYQGGQLQLNLHQLSQKEFLTSEITSPLTTVHKLNGLSMNDQFKLLLNE